MNKTTQTQKAIYNYLYHYINYKTEKKSTSILLEDRVFYARGRDYKEYIHTHIYIIREGNGTPLQYSCLENPTDGGAC